MKTLIFVINFNSKFRKFLVIYIKIALSSDICTWCLDTAMKTQAELGRPTKECGVAHDVYGLTLVKLPSLKMRSAS